MSGLITVGFTSYGALPSIPLNIPFKITNYGYYIMNINISDEATIKHMFQPEISQLIELEIFNIHYDDSYYLLASYLPTLTQLEFLKTNNKCLKTNNKSFTNTLKYLDIISDQINISEITFLTQLKTLYRKYNTKIPEELLIILKCLDNQPNLYEVIFEFNPKLTGDPIKNVSFCIYQRTKEHDKRRKSN
ncbi:hypothetical protein H8356DRAFT_1429837 [Neocallimastix lanati (nom. inval.)]|nr:hypothetical protein H8356DRAFT_1429837 [Neocallimastix sp. JGI-2020a]